MAIIKPPSKNAVSPKVIALTSYNLYMERVKSVTEKLRANNLALDYVPLQFGGIQGQQESLLANSAVKIVDFKVTESE